MAQAMKIRKGDLVQVLSGKDRGKRGRVLKVVPETGGIPLRTRPQPRQDYHALELDRWRKFLKMPLNLKPREIGLIRVIKADPFASSAEVESTIQGVTLEQGDTVVEQTAGYVLSN